MVAMDYPELKVRGFAAVVHRGPCCARRRTFRKWFSFTIFLAQSSRIVYGKPTNKNTPRNFQRDQSSSADHQIRNNPPNTTTTKFAKWIAMKIQGQLPVCRR
jgi:hypothetical protein